MSEEEKKALDILVNEVADIVIGEYCTHCKICDNEDMECCYTKAIDTIYDLTKRQQEEIEDLKIRLQDTLSRQKNTLYFCIDDYVSKDKIKEKIKELRKEEDKIEKLDYTAEPEKAIDVVLLRIADLNELLGDNTNE